MGCVHSTLHTLNDSLSVRISIKYSFYIPPDTQQCLCTHQKRNGNIVLIMKLKLIKLKGMSEASKNELLKTWWWHHQLRRAGSHHCNFFLQHSKITSYEEFGKVQHLEMSRNTLKLHSKLKMTYFLLVLAYTPQRFF